MTKPQTLRIKLKDNGQTEITIGARRLENLLGVEIVIHQNVSIASIMLPLGGSDMEFEEVRFIFSVRDKQKALENLAQLTKQVQAMPDPPPAKPSDEAHDSHPPVEAGAKGERRDMQAEEAPA